MNKFIQITHFPKAQKPVRSPQRGTQHGVILIETLVAILLFSMGVLALIGVQAAMISNTSASQYRSVASQIAQQRLGVMWSDPGNLAAYVETNTPVPALPNGLRTVTQPTAGEIVILVTWQQPGRPEIRRYSTNARIVGT